MNSMMRVLLQPLDKYMKSKYNMRLPLHSGHTTAQESASLVYKQFVVSRSIRWSEAVRDSVMLLTGKYLNICMIPWFSNDQTRLPPFGYRKPEHGLELQYSSNKVAGSNSVPNSSARQIATMRRDERFQQTAAPKLHGNYQ
jgi:hypothetical protein